MTQFSRSMKIECWGTGVDFLVVTPFYVVSFMCFLCVCLTYRVIEVRGERILCIRKPRFLFLFYSSHYCFAFLLFFTFLMYLHSGVQPVQAQDRHHHRSDANRAGQGHSGADRQKVGFPGERIYIV